MSETVTSRTAGSGLRSSSVPQSNSSLARPCLLFIHGWGFDASIWDPLRSQLSDWPQAVLRFGYFDADPTAADGGTMSADPADPADPVDPVPGRPLVLIGHSYGFMRALDRLGPSCRGLVSINGFARFCAGPDFADGVAPRVLDRMLRRLSTETVAVVDEFRRRCGADPSRSAVRLDPLVRDLGVMRTEDRRQDLRDCRLPLLVLAGDADPIVPVAMTLAAHKGYEMESDIRWREGGGHLLPMSDPQWCAAQLREFLDRLDSELPEQSPTRI